MLTRMNCELELYLLTKAQLLYQAHVGYRLQIAWLGNDTDVRATRPTDIIRHCSTRLVVGNSEASESASFELEQSSFSAYFQVLT